MIGVGQDITARKEVEPLKSQRVADGLRRPHRTERLFQEEVAFNYS